MATGLMQVRVKAGCQLAHGGAVLDPGADLALPTALALEVRHLVEEVLPTGETRPVGFDDQAAAALATALSTAQPHERISILQQARAKVTDEATKLDAAIAAEQKRLDAEAKKAAKAPPAADPPKTEKAEK